MDDYQHLIAKWYQPRIGCPAVEPLGLEIQRAARYAHRVGFLGAQIEGALQPDIKCPAGEEVAAIDEALRAMELKVRELCAIGPAATECPGPILLAMQAKALRRLPAPAQQGLEDLLQISQVDVAGDQNASPDHGTDAVEHQAQL